MYPSGAGGVLPRGDVAIGMNMPSSGNGVLKSSVLTSPSSTTSPGITIPLSMLPFPCGARTSRYAYLDRLSPWSVQRLLCIQDNHRWYSVEVVVSCTVSALSNQAITHTLYHLPSICTILFPIACRPSPVACIPNVRSFCVGEGGGVVCRC